MAPVRARHCLPARTVSVVRYPRCAVCAARRCEWRPPGSESPRLPLAAGVRPAALFRCFIESGSTNDPETAQTAELLWCYNWEDLAAFKDEAPALPPLEATSDDDALAEGAAFAPGDRVDARYKKGGRAGTQAT